MPLTIKRSRGRGAGADEYVGARWRWEARPGLRPVASGGKPSYQDQGDDHAEADNELGVALLRRPHSVPVQ